MTSNVNELGRLRVVHKRWAGKPGVTSWLLRMTGKGGDGPWDYYFNDGYVFRPYVVGEGRDTLAARGCSDPSGAKFQKYVDVIGLKGPHGKPLKPGHFVNWLELDHD